jgi:L-ascorbate metabolism protein UlaG (beta-lactamase superfamily)
MKPLHVTFVSHACLKIRGQFGTLVCDPWILNEPVFNFTTWKFPAALIPPEEVARGVDYLLITHSHEDHFHVPSLNYFSRDVKVLLPAYDNHPALRAQTVERVLRGLGFWNIEKIRSWDHYLLGGNTKLTMVPSAASRERDWENAGFVIEHPDCVLLNMNDNVNDVALCEQIVARWPRVDIGWIQTGGVTMYPGCFRMSAEEMRAEAAKRKEAFLDQRRMLTHIRPKAIAPFAGDFCWLDDRYFHNNWANRSTPKLFRDMMEQDYADSGIELLVFHPGDTWTKAGGFVRNHPPIDWENYLEEIRRVKRRFQWKVDRIERWICDVDYRDLHARSVRHTKMVEKWITRDFIDFTARFRIAVEGPNSDFAFVVKADPVNKFQVDWNDDAPVDQTLYVREAVWAAILEGKLMWNIIQWPGQAHQPVPYRLDMGKFWFWMEYHVDLNSRNVQANLADRLWPHLKERFRPTYGTFPMQGEWGGLAAAE